VNPKDVEATLYVAQYHAMLREHRAAMQYLERALTLAPQSAEVKFNAALVYNQFDDTSRTLSALKQALTAGYPVSQLDVTPNFAKLRANPRFEELRQTYGKSERRVE